MKGARKREGKLFREWLCVLSILTCLPLMAIAKEEVEMDGSLTEIGQLSEGDRTPGDTEPICKNNSAISMCSSSSRFKDQVQDLHLGMEAVQKLRPVTFRWKGKRDYDLGFIAEEVAAVAPILATYGSKGAEGVKYSQITAVLVKALQEIKAENEQLKIETSELKAANETLKSTNADIEDRLAKLEKLVLSLEEKVTGVK